MCGRDAQRCRFFLVVCSDFSLPWNETNRVSCSPPFNPSFLFFFIFFSLCYTLIIPVTMTVIGLRSSRTFARVELEELAGIDIYLYSSNRFAHASRVTY